MAIVVKQNQINIGNLGNQSYANTAAQNILQTIVNLFASVSSAWRLDEDVNVWIEGNPNANYSTIYTAMLQNENTNEYMRLWFAAGYNQNTYPNFFRFYLTDSNQTSSYNHVYVHKNNLFRSYQPSNSAKYWSHEICNVMCGISDSTIAKELGNDLGLKLPLFELFYGLNSTTPVWRNCSFSSEGGSSQTDLYFSSESSVFSNKTLKFALVADDEDSKFVFITNVNNVPTVLRWSSYNGELVIPANENDQYLQGAVFNSYPDTKQRAVFRAVDGSIQFGQYDTVLDGVALPAGAASDEGIVASPLFLSSQLESAGLDVPNVDNGSGYKGQIKTDWLLVSNSQVAGTTHNQGTWLNVGGGILVPWSPDAGSPFIS